MPGRTLRSCDLAVCSLLLACAQVLPGCSSAPSSSRDHLPQGEARQLLSAAAGMANADFAALATSANPTGATVPSQSLTYLFMASAPDPDQPDICEDIAWAHQTPPNPRELAEAMAKSQPLGYCSVIQPEFITDLQLTAADGKASGVVAIHAQELYAGKLEFQAEYVNQAWVVQEWKLPKSKIVLRRQADGGWKSTLPR